MNSDIIKKIKSLKKAATPLLSSILALLLVACSSAPTHVILAPEITQIPHHKYQNTHVSLKVVDMRASNHVVQILKEGKAATVLSSEQRLEKLVAAVMTDTWKKQGVQFNQLSNTQVKIIIDKAITSVNQKAMSYDTQSEIIITVKIETPKQTLTNTFKSRGNSEGVLKADIAVLERDFNQNLNTLLTQIVNSKDVKSFL